MISRATLRRRHRIRIRRRAETWITRGLVLVALGLSLAAVKIATVTLQDVHDTYVEAIATVLQLRVDRGVPPMQRPLCLRKECT